jgi:hypothetical protein
MAESSERAHTPDEASYTAAPRDHARLPYEGVRHHDRRAMPRREAP